jgi:hypothetical protein
MRTFKTCASGKCGDLGGGESVPRGDPSLVRRAIVGPLRGPGEWRLCTFGEFWGILGTTVSGEVLPLVTRAGGCSVQMVTVSNSPNQDDSVLRLNPLHRWPIRTCQTNFAHRLHVCDDVPSAPMADPHLPS